MNKRHFEEGDVVDAISTAGEAFDEYEQDGIRASVFTHPFFYVIPMLSSDAPGSGKLGAFLAALRGELTDRPIRFANVINGPLKVRLIAEGFDVIPDDEFEALFEADIERFAKDGGA